MPRESPHPPNESPHPATAAVILLHALPDGSSHFDWLIEIPNRREEHRLLSFRSHTRPDHTDPDTLFHVEQLSDHRAHYLTHEGDIGAGRGIVRRVAQGVCTRFLPSPEADDLELVIAWEAGGTRVYHGSLKSPKNWAFRSSE